MFTLKDYQTDLAYKFVSSMNQGGAPCLVSPTGSGKTVMLAEAARWYREWGYPVLLAAHRNTIVKQLAKSCSFHCKERVGFYTAKNVTEDCGIMVTMTPTLTRRTGAAKTFQGRVLLLDEAHHIQAPGVQRIIKEMQPAFFGGASATPVTATGAGLKKFGITELIIGPQPKELMDRGDLCTYELFCAKDAIVNTTGMRSRGGDYKTEEIEERIVNVKGDFLRDLLRFNPNLLPTITVTISKTHAFILLEEYIRGGIRAEIMLGETPDDERELIFNRLETGQTQVVISVAVIDEGTDLPAAVCLQLIRPTRSLRLWKQLIGRVLRADKDNPDKIAIIIDHGNCWENMPLPHLPIHWTLEGKVKIDRSDVEVDTQNRVVIFDRPPRAKLASVAQGDKKNLEKLSIEELAEINATKRLSALKKNLYLVEQQGFNPAILWPWANNPEGLTEEQKWRVERAIGLPMGFCNAQTPMYSYY
jgi:DNA repair protein RadD